MAVKAIGFDYYGVLTQYTPGDFRDSMAELFGTSVDEFSAAYRQANKRLYDTKDIKPDQLWSEVAKTLGRPGKAVAAERFYNNQPGPGVNAQMIGLVDHLRARGYKTGLLSNVGDDWVQELRNDGVDTHFDAVLISGEIGVSKPDPKAFELLASRLGVKTHELVFIDDVSMYLQHAAEIGFYPIHFESYEKLLQDLRAAGIKAL